MLSLGVLQHCQLHPATRAEPRHPATHCQLHPATHAEPRRLVTHAEPRHPATLCQWRPATQLRPATHAELRRNDCVLQRMQHIVNKRPVAIASCNTSSATMGWRSSTFKKYWDVQRMTLWDVQKILGRPKNIGTSKKYWDVQKILGRPKILPPKQIHV